MFLEIIILAALILAAVALVGAIALTISWQLAPLQKGFLTTIPRGEFIVSTAQGGTIKNILVNSEDLMVSKQKDPFGNSWFIRNKKAEKALFGRFPRFGRKFWIFLWKNTGVAWGGLWPFWGPQGFKVDTSRIVKEEGEIQTENLEGLRNGIDPNHGEITVRSVRTLVKVPVLVTDVQLPKDGTSVHVLLEVTMEAVNPFRLFYIRTIQEEAKKFVNNAVQNWAAIGDIDYNGWRREDKGPEGPLIQYLIGQNVTKGYLTQIETASSVLAKRLNEMRGDTETTEATRTNDSTQLPTGAIALIGYGFREGRVVGWSPTDETKKLAELVQAKEKAVLQAAADVAKATGERDAGLLKAEIPAAEFDKQMKALMDRGLTAEQSANLLSGVLTAREMKDLKGTLVHGSSGTVLQIPTNPSN